MWRPRQTRALATGGWVSCFGSGLFSTKRPQKYVRKFFVDSQTARAHGEIV